MKDALAPARYEVLCASLYSMVRLFALRNRHEIAPPRTDIELARARNFLVGIADHLVPLRDPADGARHREHRGEHASRNADRLVDDARVKIDVRIQLA